MTCSYCNGRYGGSGQHVYFLNGVSHTVEFDTSVEWNGKTPDKIKFNVVAQSWPDKTRSYDMGSAAWIAGGYVVMSFDASMSTPPAYVWVTPPIYFRADLSVDNAFKAGIDGWNGATGQELICKIRMATA